MSNIDLVKFSAGWTAVSALGWATGFVAAWVALFFTGDTVAVIAAEFVAGAVAGCAQWLLIRSHLRLSAWWMVVTSASWGMAWLVLLWLAAWLELSDTMGGAMASMRVMPPPATFALMGFMVGAIQFFLLRRTIRRAGWWIPSTGFAWGAAALVSEFEYHLLANPFSYMQTEFIGWSLMGVTVGIVTGLVLGLMMLSNHAHRPEHTTNE